MSSTPYRGRIGSYLSVVTAALVAVSGANAQPGSTKPPAQYTKKEVQIAMRDGVKLFTSIYSPTDTTQKYPILLERTPYSCSPYGPKDRNGQPGPNQKLSQEGYIVVYQDVRGRFMSEGTFENMRPQIDKKASTKDIDESSDTYDTIDWLVKNVPNHNGRVGMWGISYPGFYAAAGMIDAHPALKAVSPQAPIADWFFDDFHHHGAFFLPHAFNFMAWFGRPRPEPTTKFGSSFDHGTPDGYQFFLELGSLKHADERYFKGSVAYWNEMAAHPNYDAFWQARNLLPHLKHTAPAVMTVGGWFDAEDLYGALKIYKQVEKDNPGIFNVLVMGPWRHGGWAFGDGSSLGNISFPNKPSAYYRENMETPFFNHYLKDEGAANLAEANVYETGVNRWRTFDHWPPRETAKKNLFLHKGGQLSFQPSTRNNASDSFVSDPNKPVPFTEAISTNMTAEYMTDDQRFAGRRTDVLAYETDVLEEDVTLAGPLMANLWVSTSGTDSDWIVKLIDVFPDRATDFRGMTPGKHLGDYQMMVRSEIIRGRFRNSYAKPEPFVPDKPSKIALELQDVLHTFQKGHRIMVQVQSSWFPLVDRNPQKYVDNIFEADDKDFVKATQHVYCSKQHPSHLTVGVLPAAK